MTDSYKKRRDENAESIMGPSPAYMRIKGGYISPAQEATFDSGCRGFKLGADWSRADLAKELKERILCHAQAYSTDIFADYTLKENPNPSIDQVGGKMGRHMCEVFLLYIEEAIKGEK